MPKWVEIIFTTSCLQLQHLAIKAISEQLPSDVTAISANSKTVIVAAEERIFSLVYNRKVTKEFSRGYHTSPVRTLLTLGDEHFISADEKGAVFVWCVEDESKLSIFYLLDNLSLIHI